ncbi:unnamed protein product, partial [Hapterophycus canaliculatus]
RAICRHSNTHGDRPHSVKKCAPASFVAMAVDSAGMRRGRGDRERDTHLVRVTCPEPPDGGPANGYHGDESALATIFRGGRETFRWFIRLQQPRVQAYRGRSLTAWRSTDQGCVRALAHTDIYPRTAVPGLSLGVFNGKIANIIRK